MARPVYEPLLKRLRAVEAHLARVDVKDSSQTVEELAQARDELHLALDEAMALAALDGLSLRAIAGLAGLAPNSVPPRLARTASLSPYQNQAGKVVSPGVERARYDQERGTPKPSEPTAPLRFRRRRSD